MRGSKFFIVSFDTINDSINDIIKFKMSSKYHKMSQNVIHDTINDVLNFKNSINHHKKIGVYYGYKEGDCLCVSLI